MISFLRRRKGRKVLVIGLDCAEPTLVFDRWKNELPTLSGLRSHGAYGTLESSIPCITVPAWSCMMTGKDPGTLGFYGFRNRADRSYDGMTIATSAAVQEPRVWDLLGRAGKQVVLVGVPQTYPIQPVNGYLVSGFLTPASRGIATFPDSLRHEIDRVLNGRAYDADVVPFRTDDKEDLLRRIYEMTEKRFAVIRHLLHEKPWDFFMFVEMGVDRIHHGFWRYMDEEHRAYEPDGPFRHAIRDYYRYVDSELGTLLSGVDDDAVVFVVSDHGAKRLDGGICINEWLRREGYLVLKEEPRQVAGRPVPFDHAAVDWGQTTAWGEGGYYARISLNVQGREPNGLVPPSDYERIRDEIAAGLEALPDPDGRPMPTKCFRPGQIYRGVKNVAPDLLVYLGDLHWRSVGSIGFDSVYTVENDTGPDDANHAQQGLFILYDPRRNLRGGRIDGAHLMDIAPTVLHLMNQPVPDDMQGRVLQF